MGIFLSMSGVIGADRARVERALSQYARTHADRFALNDAGDEEGPHVTVIAEKGANVTVLYPGSFVNWDAASRHLSAELRVPVFSLHVHDGDLWMFVLFHQGRKVDRFNPIPHYWDWQMPPSQRRQWRGNAAVVARCVPRLKPEMIAGYLRQWGDDLLGEPPSKRAYPDDRYKTGDCWQIADFMGRVGLKIPIENDGTINGHTYNL